MLFFMLFFQAAQKNRHGEVFFSHFFHSSFSSHSLILPFDIFKSTSVPTFRKIEIVQFASRTRQLFVRLLALVKWASNAGKVEKCAVCCVCVWISNITVCWWKLCSSEH